MTSLFLQCRVWIAITMTPLSVLATIALAAPPATESWVLTAAQPSALLTIDQNRTTVIDHIVSDWGDALAKSGAGLSQDQLREILTALRSDHLLAASLAGTLDGLRDVIANALTATAAVKPSLLQAKALGDTNDDLVYTPVVPCRLADTRVAGGAIAANTTRDFKVWVSSGGFTGQGGDAGNCNVPANPPAVVLNFAVVNPGGLGNLIAYPSGAALPNTSVLNYQSGTFALSNGAIIPACTPNCANQVSVKTNGAAAEVVIDVVGYFKPAVNSTTGAFEVAVNGNLALQIRPDATSPILIAGSNANTVTAGASGATIGGGGAPGTVILTSNCNPNCANRVTDAFGTIGGGAGNQAGDAAGTAIDAVFATVGGGLVNKAVGYYATVAGGAGNSAGSPSSFGATVGGGSVNSAVGDRATVAGGVQNTAGGDVATVGGGNQNSAGGGGATVAGGGHNSAGGIFAIVAGGGWNNAGGDYSFAAGQQAKATEQGMFVWSDSRPFTFDPVLIRGSGQGTNSFNVRATGIGGVYFVTGIDGSTGAPTWGCYTQNGSGWSCTSDRNVKRNLVRLDGTSVLSKLAVMPIYRWQPKDGPNAEVTHFGPMAQDFYAAFGLGDSDKAIGLQDAEGVALAAIQGLHQTMRQQMREKDKEIAQLRRKLQAIEARLGL